jgi:hypothetical protein
MRGRVRKLEDDTFIVVYYKECVEDSEAVIPVSCKLMPGFSHFKDGDNIEFELIEFAKEDGSFDSYVRPYISINPHITKVIDTNEDDEADMGDKLVDLLSTLKSKIYWGITNDGSIKGCGLAMENAEKLEEVFDDYAVDFLEWCNENYEFYHGDAEYYSHTKREWYKPKELLLIYKKEKGL